MCKSRVRLSSRVYQSLIYLLTRVYDEKKVKRVVAFEVFILHEAFEVAAPFEGCMKRDDNNVVMGEACKFMGNGSIRLYANLVSSFRASSFS